MDNAEQVTFTFRKVGERLSFWVNGTPVANIELDHFSIEESHGMANVTASGVVIKKGEE